MTNAIKVILLFGILRASNGWSSIRLFPGFVTKVSCQGRLLVSAIGNDLSVRLEALPRELGCGAILKPNAQRGSTNLILETSTGTIREIVSIETGSPKPEQLSISLEPNTEPEEDKK